MTRPVLHVVTDDAVLLRSDFHDTASAILRAGGPEVALHLRGPSMEGRFLLEVGRDLLLGARVVGARLVVNDRIDVAGCLGADGVQLRQGSLPVEVARRLLSSAYFGVSVHDAREARAARAADWFMVGSVFATRSHPGRTPGGLELLDRVGEAAPGVPQVAIGGVTPDRVAELRHRGAAGVGVIRGIWEDPSPPDAVGRYLRAWEEASNGAGNRTETR
jgi:thiamine-phosphate diphosphorylase